MVSLYNLWEKNMVLGLLLVKNSHGNLLLAVLDTYTWTCQCCLTNKNLFTSAQYRHRMKPGGLTRSDG